MHKKRSFKFKKHVLIRNMQKKKETSFELRPKKIETKNIKKWDEL